MTLLSPSEEVTMLQRYVEKGDEELDGVTDLLMKVLDSGAWARFTTPVGFVAEHDSFRSFVTTPRWKGLGTNRDALTAWVSTTNPELAQRIAQAWKLEVPAANVNGAVGRGRVSSRATRANESDSADAVLSRLKRDDPDLAEEVINGRVTANAAALQKGWRKPRIVLTSPASVAGQIRKHWTDEQIHTLQEALS